MKKKININENSLKNLNIIKNTEDAKRLGRAGGLKSGEKRRTLKKIREWAEQNLFVERGEEKKPLYEILFNKLEELSNLGSLKAIEMLLNYSGLKPIEHVENNTNLKFKDFLDNLE